MSNLTHVSASSITLFRDCERKWYYRYILGYKGPTTAAMTRGTEVHEQLENYLLNGTTPDQGDTAGQIATSGLTLLPESVLRVEASLDDFPLAQHLGVDFKGFIDVLAEDRPDQVHILDHKTTADLKYAKTEQELAQNTQLIIYAKHVLDNNPQYSTVRLSHIYYTTRKPYRSARVSTVLLRDEVDTAFADIADSVALMLSAAERGMDDTNKNPKYCNAYNKQCEHFNDCFITLERRLREPMSEKKVNLMAFLRGETNDIAGVTMQVGSTAVGSTDVGSTDVGSDVGSTDVGSDVGSTDVGSDVGSAVELFIGVHQLGCSVAPLTTALDPLLAEVCALHKVTHIALVPYGGGWNSLAALLAERGLPAGKWYIDPMSQLYSRLAEDLHRCATRIYIRG